jgi:hypothetical protein
MSSIDYSKFYNYQQPPAVAAAPPFSPPPGSNVPPYYANEQPIFVLPGSGPAYASGLTTIGGAPTGPTGGSSSGSSVAPPGGFLRNPASISGGKPGGGGGGGGSGSADAAAEEPEKGGAVAKDALGTSFETPLTGGGTHSYMGSGSGGGKEETPKPEGLLGGNSAATGLSPNQMYQTALEGTDGAEEGSMAGVSGRNDASLFDITRQKLTKMFETGNVGVSKNVEVRN